MSRILTLGTLALLAILAHLIMVPAQPISAKAEVLQAERREISVLYALERRKGPGKATITPAQYKKMHLQDVLTKLESLPQDALPTAREKCISDVVGALQGLHQAKNIRKREYMEEMKNMKDEVEAIQAKLKNHDTLNRINSALEQAEEDTVGWSD